MYLCGCLLTNQHTATLGKGGKEKEDHVDNFDSKVIRARLSSQIESESEVAQSCPTLWDPWTIVYQAPPFMGFSRHEYWRGLPLPSPGHLPDPGIKPGSPAL